LYRLTIVSGAVTASEAFVETSASSNLKAIATYVTD